MIRNRVKVRVGDILSGLLFLNVEKYNEKQIYFLFGKIPCKIIQESKENYIIQRVLDTQNNKKYESVPKRIVFRAAFYSKKRNRLYEIQVYNLQKSLLLIQKKTYKEEDYEKERKNCKACTACKKSCTSNKSVDSYVFLDLISP